VKTAPPLCHCASKTGEIANDAAAKCKHMIRAGHAERQQPIGELLQNGPAFSAFARFDYEPIGLVIL